jgi:hypothetical protein
VGFNSAFKGLKDMDKSRKWYNIGDKKSMGKGRI